MSRPRTRRKAAWLRHGPRILGYEPGWLWTVLAIALIVAGVWITAKGLHHKQATAAQIDAMIVAHASDQGLPVELIRAVVEAESGGDPLAHSEADARGLMQITPITLEDVRRRYGLPAGNLYDPDYNLKVGTTYLRHLLDRFDNDTTLALAAYHMGPTIIARHRRNDPGLSSQELVDKYAGPKTRAYVERVLEMYSKN